MFFNFKINCSPPNHTALVVSLYIAYHYIYILNSLYFFSRATNNQGHIFHLETITIKAKNKSFKYNQSIYIVELTNIQIVQAFR